MNKGIIVTGATSGIGKALAMLAAESGYKVLASGRNENSLNELAKKNSNILSVKCDVTNLEDVKNMIDYAKSNMFSIDIIVNNAGIGIFDSLVDSKLEDWHLMVDTNIKGLLNVLHTSLPHLIKNKGHIINIGSIAAYNVYPNTGVYCATKHAVLAISESLRAELSKKIKITTISPGAVNTSFLQSTKNENLFNQYKSSFENGMSPEFIAKQILYTIEMPEDTNISEMIIRPFQK